MSLRLLIPGTLDYDDAWDLQRRTAEQRALGNVSDTLIVLQHPHTYTIGRSGSEENLLWGAAQREQKGVTLHYVDRGGDITYHGPGQLVAYPIVYLGQPTIEGRLLKADYVGYLRRLESVLITVLNHFGVQASREAGYTGVWVPDHGKIAAIGVRVNAHGVSTHGLALNVHPDLTYFDGIIPCGITDRAVTSMAELLGNRCPPHHIVEDAFIRVFMENWGDK